MRALTPVLALCGASLCFGQSPTTPLSDEITALSGLAHAVPAEFSSDALIRLGASEKITPPSRRIALLREAFEIAMGAQEPLPRKWIHSGVYLPVNRTFARGMDRVSLQARAVRGLLPLDPRLARELFSQIRFQLPGVGLCSEPLIYDLSLYYSAMTEVLNATADHKEAEADLNAHLTSAFTSSAQVTPLARMLTALRPGPEAFPGALLLYTGKLSRLEKDSAIFSSEFPATIITLVKLTERLPPASREALLKNARSWTITGIAGGLCQPRQVFGIRGNKVSPVAWIDPVSRFNNQLLPLGPAIPGLEIKPEDVPDVANKPSSPIYRRSAAWMRFVEAFEAIKTGGARDSLPWKEEMERFLTSLIAWTAPSTDDPDEENGFYLEKANLLLTVLNLQLSTAPVSSQAEFDKLMGGPKAEFLGRERARAALIAHLQSPVAGRVYNRRRIVWFAAFSGEFGLATPDNEMGAILTALISSRDPVLALQGRLFRFLAKP